MLPHVMVEWVDKDLQDRCTLYVWTLSGLEPTEIQAKILKGGEVLQMRFPWPAALQDARQLTAGRYCSDSSKVVEIETILKKMKGGSSDAMVSTTIDFHLGMRVEEQFKNEVVQSSVTGQKNMKRAIRSFAFGSVGRARLNRFPSSSRSLR